MPRRHHEHRPFTEMLLLAMVHPHSQCPAQHISYNIWVEWSVCALDGGDGTGRKTSCFYPQVCVPTCEDWQLSVPAKALRSLDQAPPGCTVTRMALRSGRMMSCFEILPMVWVDWEEKLAVWILADIVVELGFVYCK
jgi:hypothetical protein